MRRRQPRELLEAVEHRPWPLPRGPWVMRQSWQHLLFAHWPLPPGALRPLVPRELELDLFAAEAWLSIAPFRMTGVRLRGLPPLPGVRSFEELNVRTYVRLGDRPGVWFLSLDAASRLAVLAARAWFRLPYFHARMSLREEQGAVRYRSRRAQSGAAPAELELEYGPVGEARCAAPGSLEHFLAERYRLYARGRGGKPLFADVHHPPWPLQPARAELGRNTMTAALGLRLPERAPLLHFARRQDVLVWAPRQGSSPETA